MGVEEPGTCDPLEDFLGGGESSFVNIEAEAEKFEYSDLRARQADARRISDVGFIMKKLTVRHISCQVLDTRDYLPLIQRDST